MTDPLLPPSAPELVGLSCELAIEPGDRVFRESIPMHATLKNVRDTARTIPPAGQTSPYEYLLAPDAGGPVLRLSRAIAESRRAGPDGVRTPGEPPDRLAPGATRTVAEDLASLADGHLLPGRWRVQATVPALPNVASAPVPLEIVPLVPTFRATTFCHETNTLQTAVVDANGALFRTGPGDDGRRGVFVRAKGSAGATSAVHGVQVGESLAGWVAWTTDAALHLAEALGSYASAASTPIPSGSRLVAPGFYEEGRATFLVRTAPDKVRPYAFTKAFEEGGEIAIPAKAEHLAVRATAAGFELVWTVTNGTSSHLQALAIGGKKATPGPVRTLLEAAGPVAAAAVSSVAPRTGAVFHVLCGPDAKGKLASHAAIDAPKPAWVTTEFSPPPGKALEYAIAPEVAGGSVAAVTDEGILVSTAGGAWRTVVAVAKASQLALVKTSSRGLQVEFVAPGSGVQAQPLNARDPRANE